ncbi:hypothetical protein PUN28_018171 [Cardiocondyla obscurior]|uniref:Uncharacterized protein n=1 Tax=Cardiocondyla obscurior TaxID=286306 RepID=A0AAW2EJZ2_9HYME
MLCIAQTAFSQRDRPVDSINSNAVDVLLSSNHIAKETSRIFRWYDDGEDRHQASSEQPSAYLMHKSIPNGSLLLLLPSHTTALVNDRHDMAKSLLLNNSAAAHRLCE